MSKTGSVLPIIFLITDGTVEDEKDICHAMKGHLMKEGLTSPRICTFGIGEAFSICLYQIHGSMKNNLYKPCFSTIRFVANYPFRHT